MIDLSFFHTQSVLRMSVLTIDFEGSKKVRASIITEMDQNEPKWTKLNRNGVIMDRNGDIMKRNGVLGDQNGEKKKSQIRAKWT